jgi:hypothetical protein
MREELVEGRPEVARVGVPVVVAGRRARAVRPVVAMPPQDHHLPVVSVERLPEVEALEAQAEQMAVPAGPRVIVPTL